MDETYRIWASVVALLLLGTVGYKLWGGFKTAVKTAVDENFKAISDQIIEINQRLDVVDMEACKNFLVRCIADVERGETMSETESERFWEQYDYYIKSGHNTYVKNKVEKLKKEGKL